MTHSIIAALNLTASGASFTDYSLCGYEQFLKSWNHLFHLKLRGVSIPLFISTIHFSTPQFLSPFLNSQTFVHCSVFHCGNVPVLTELRSPNAYHTSFNHPHDMTLHNSENPSHHRYPHSNGRAEQPAKMEICGVEELWATVWKHRLNNSLDKTLVAGAIRKHANLHSSAIQSDNGKWVDAFDFHRHSTPMWGPRDPSGLLKQYPLLQRTLTESTSHHPLSNLPPPRATALGSHRHQNFFPSREGNPCSTPTAPLPTTRVAKRKKVSGNTHFGNEANASYSGLKRFKQMASMDATASQATTRTGIKPARLSPPRNVSADLRDQSRKERASDKVAREQNAFRTNIESEDSLRAPLAAPSPVGGSAEPHEVVGHVEQHGTQKEHKTYTNATAAPSTGERRNMLAVQTSTPTAMAPHRDEKEGKVDVDKSQQEESKSNTNIADASDCKRVKKLAMSSVPVQDQVLNEVNDQVTAPRNTPRSKTKEVVEQKEVASVISRLWPRALSTLTVPGMRKSCKITKDTYLRFCNYPDMLHNEVSMEFGIRCVCELNLFPLQPSDKDSISSFYNPFIMSSFADPVKRKRISLPAATQKFARWIKHLPSALDSEWTAFLLYYEDCNDTDSVGHYVFVAVRNISLVFNTIWDQVTNGPGTGHGFDLYDKLKINSPQIFVIDSLDCVNDDLFEKVVSVLRVIFLLKWNLAAKHTTRAKSRHVTGSKHGTQLDEVLDAAENFYRMGLINVQGPSQGNELICGSIVLAHFVKAQKKGYLDSIAVRAVKRYKYPHRNCNVIPGGTDAIRTIKMRKLFTLPFVRKVNIIISDFIYSCFKDVLP